MFPREHVGEELLLVRERSDRVHVAQLFRGAIASTVTIATWGWLMIGSVIRAPNGPGLESVNVPPATSSPRGLSPRALLPRSSIARASAGTPSRFARSLRPGH
jgi:hypothetical protein